MYLFLGDHSDNYHKLKTVWNRRISLQSKLTMCLRYAQYDDFTLFVVSWSVVAMQLMLSLYQGYY